MDELFLTLLNMSINAGWLVLVVLLMRLLLKKAPKAVRCGLWMIVALRLVFPFSFESVWSLIPSAKPIPPNILYSPQPSIQSGVPLIDNAVNPILSESLSPNPGDSVNPLQILTAIAANIWLLGMVAMMLYIVISYVRVYRQVRVRLPLEHRVYECDAIRTPFLFGLFRPAIYLPSSLSQEDRPFVIAHEQAHVKRLDHLWKPLGFLLLTVYWFNPLMWVAYLLLCRDIELACDERVIREMDKDDIAAYTEALLHCSSKQAFVTACPLAFGESGVKTRIKSALHYKKPTFWLILIAVVSCFAVAVCFLSDPETNRPLDTFGSGSELKGVSVSVESLDLNADKPSITVLWQNHSGKDVIYGESFRLYRIENGELIDTNLIVNSAFNAIGYFLDRNGIVHKTYSLSGYNVSERATYRFESTVNLKNGDAASYKVWVDFTIENGAASPLIATDDNFTIESDELLYQNARVTYPVLTSTQHDYTVLNTFLKNNIESRLYDIGKGHPQNSVIDMTYRITHRDNTIVSVLFEGTLTEPSDDVTKLAFTACLAPGNGYTVNPESLIDLSSFMLENFRKQWLSLWDDANLTYQHHQEILETINGYSSAQLNALLLDPDSADLGFTANGILVVFRGKPSIADYVLFEIPYPDTDVSFDEYTYNDSPEPSPPTLKLSDNTNTFEFCFSMFSSYLPTGTYALENNVLTLNTSDGNYYYTFLRVDNGFVFDAAESSPLPSYRYSEGGEAICPVPNGAMFQRATAEPQPTLELHMPDAIYDTYSSYAGQMTDMYTKASTDTIRVDTIGGDDEPRYVTLTDAQIYHLNKLYAAVTDFSEQDGPAPTDIVILIKHDGKSDLFYYAHAKQAELNLYINALMDACDMSLIGLHELYETGDASALPYTSVYCNDEKGTTDIAFKDGALYCQSYLDQTQYLDYFINGEWESLEGELFESLGLQNTVTYPLYERIGSWILFSNAEHAIFLLDTTANTVYDLHMTLVDWRKVATDNESRLAFLSAVPTEQNGEIYTYEIRLYNFD